MGRDKVSYEQKNAHNDVLRYGYDVGTGYFSNRDTILIRGVQVNMVGSDTCCDTEFQVLRFGNDVLREVARVEGSGDQNFGLER